MRARLYKTKKNVQKITWHMKAFFKKVLLWWPDGEDIVKPMFSGFHTMVK